MYTEYNHAAIVTILGKCCSFQNHFLIPNHKLKLSLPKFVSWSFPRSHDKGYNNNLVMFSDFLSLYFLMGKKLCKSKHRPDTLIRYGKIIMLLKI